MYEIPVSLKHSDTITQIIKCLESNTTTSNDKFEFVDDQKSPHTELYNCVSKAIHMPKKNLTRTKSLMNQTELL